MHLLSDKRAFLFDLGNTLVEVSHACEAAVSMMFYELDKRYNLSYTLKDAIRVWWGSWSKVTADSGLIKDKIRVLTELFCKKLEAPYDQRIISHLIDIYYSYLIPLSKPFNSAIETLRKLKSKKRLIAIISNCSERWGYGVIKTHSLDKLVDLTVISDEIGFSKPDPQIFLYALDKLGVKPSKAVMIGDDIEKDILGANNLGITSCLVTEGCKLPLNFSKGEPDIIIGKISDLLLLL